MNANNYSSYVLEYFILSLFEKNLKDYNFLFTAVLVFSILKDKDYFFNITIISLLYLKINNKFSISNT